MNKKIYQQLSFKAVTINEADFTIRGIFSTASVDRHGEIVDQKGWKLAEFMTNPVVLFAHDHYQPAIGKVTELGLNADGNLEGTIQFAAKEYDFAATIFNLYKGGFMRAFSVGFENLVYEVDQANDVIILKENTLFEISAVNVPANAMALAMSKGIDVSPLERFNEERKNRKPAEEKDLGTDKAVEVLSKSKTETIKAAIGTLTEILKTAGSDNQDGEQGRTPLAANEGGAKKISVKVLNQAIRGLLKTKKSL